MKKEHYHPSRRERRSKRKNQPSETKEDRRNSRTGPDPGKTTSKPAETPAKQVGVQTPRKKIAGRRLRLFRFAAVIVIPTLFFLLLEMGLRLSGYGVSMDFTSRQVINGTEKNLSNGHFPEQFFTPATLREGEPFALPAKKDPTTYRVFLMGESAAFGDPEPGYSMARLLEVMLHDRYPDVRFEVVNAAISAISSHVVLPIARDCSRLDSDLFIVYLGNNEVTGPYGAATVFTDRGSNLFLIRAKIALKSSRLGQLIENTFRRLRSGNEPPPALHTMEMYEQNQVRASDPRMKKVYHNFERNLNDILRAAQESNTSVIVSTMGVNLKDFAPLLSLHRPGISPEDLRNWETHDNEGLALERNGNFNEAVERYLKALEIDSEFAELSFRLAQCYWALQEFAEARKYYSLASDLDTSRFRADSKINEIIRRVAGNKADKSVYLVDTTSTFGEESPDGIPGDDLFYDQVHLRFHGNYLIARSFLEEIRQAAPKWMQQHEVDTPALSEEECARRLAYTGWDRFQMANHMLSRMKRPPYTGQSSHDGCVKRLSEEVLGLRGYSSQGTQLDESLAEYKTALKDFDFHWRLHSRYAALHRTLGVDMSEVEKHSRRVIEECPHNWAEYYSLGRSLLEEKKLKEAEKCYELGLRQDPNRAQALSNMAGLLLSEKRNLPQAIEYAGQSIKINPYMFNAYINLGNCFLALETEKEDNRQRAIAEFEKILDIAPDYTPARAAIAWVYYDQAKEMANLKKDEEAQDLLRKALKVNPDFAPAHRSLAGMLSAQGDKEGAIFHLSEYLRLNPKDTGARGMLEKLKL